MKENFLTEALAHRDILFLGTIYKFYTYLYMEQSSPLACCIVFDSSRVGSHRRADLVVCWCQVVMCRWARVSGVEPSNIRRNAVEKTHWTQSSNRFTLARTFRKKRMVNCSLAWLDFFTVLKYHLPTFYFTSAIEESTVEVLCFQMFNPSIRPSDISPLSNNTCSTMWYLCS